jgi:hypothetical protein
VSRTPGLLGGRSFARLEGTVRVGIEDMARVRIESRGWVDIDCMEKVLGRAWLVEWEV